MTITSLVKSLSTFSLLSVRMTGAVADEVRVSSGPRWESPDDPETSPSATAWLARVFGFSVDTAGAPHHQCSVPGPVPDVAKIGLTSAQARAKSPKLDGDLPLLRTNSEMLRGYAVSLYQVGLGICENMNVVEIKSRCFPLLQNGNMSCTSFMLLVPWF